MSVWCLNDRDTEAGGPREYGLIPITGPLHKRSDALTRAVSNRRGVWR